MRSITTLALPFLLACPAGKASQAVQGPAPTVGDADPSMKSKVGASVAVCAPPARADLMAIDWTPELRGDFEVAMKEGVALVKYDCKSLALVPACSLKGEYGFLGMTRRDKKIEMNNKDEVAANLPVGGISWLSDLGMKFGRESVLAAEFAMIGKRSSAKKRATRDELEGTCDEATHFVRAATVGAFAVASGTKAEVGGSAKILGKGASAGSQSATAIKAQDGDLAACEKATPDSTSAPAQCGAVLRVELEPIASGTAAPEAAPELAVPSCPKGFEMADGACRAPDAPHQCKPGDGDACEKQCKAGHAGSCATLAVMFRDGIGVAKDWAKAATFAEQACTNEDLTGCRVLAAAKLDGQGTKKDKAAALALLDQACQGGNGMGCVDLGVAKLGDKKLANDAQYAFRRACYGGGEHEGCAWLGTLYAEGKGGQKVNAKIATKFFEKGCKEGSARACAGLAALTDDKAKAKELYEKACNLGDAKACKKK